MLKPTDVLFKDSFWKKGLGMTSVTLQQAQSELARLVHGLAPGEEIVIVENNREVARLTGAGVVECDRLEKRKLGTLAGSVKAMAEGFDEPLEDMGEYMH